jgi:hypothetical protein
VGEGQGDDDHPPAGMLMLADGRVVICRRGWLSWPPGWGRPLHAVHSAGDPAGAARRLAQSVPPVGAGNLVHVMRPGDIR